MTASVIGYAYSYRQNTKSGYRCPGYLCHCYALTPLALYVLTVTAMDWYRVMLKLGHLGQICQKSLRKFEEIIGIKAGIMVRTSNIWFAYK